MTRRASLWAFTAALFSSAAAHAEPSSSVAACAAAADEGQTLRNRGRLLEAIARLSACSQPECPAVVQADCARWGAELDAVVPSVILAVREARGADVLNAELAIDGVAVPIDAGRRIRLDPGRHAVTVARRGAVVARSEFLLREREVGRRVEVVVPDAAPSTEVARRSPSRALAPWITAGGVAIGLVGGALAWSASQRFNDLDASCAPRCSAAEVDGVRTHALVADVTMGAGIVTAALGLYFLLRGSPAAPAVGERVVPGP